ncbi:MAG TPA: FAD-dependent oxidoreductase, partial [Methylomirabilota bacterium]|nr:FAD-dependent oxidoreductase [Methylomirabilota bacterium]
MTDVLRPDVCVIGAGSAGLTVAAGARAVGLSVVLIERGRMGGECLNTGCVPSKALIAAARHAHAVRRARAFGVDAGEPSVDGRRVHDHIHGVIAAIAPHDSVERFEGLGATVIAGAARFVDADTVEGAGRRIVARKVVIATGSRPAMPPIPGLDAIATLTNESVFDLTALPARLLVIGGGPIGLELAQAFTRLGSRVTVLEAEKPLANDDPDCAALVLSRLAAEGVDIRIGAHVLEAEADPEGAALVVEHEGRRERLVGTH